MPAPVCHGRPMTWDPTTRQYVCRCGAWTTAANR